MKKMTCFVVLLVAFVFVVPAVSLGTDMAAKVTNEKQALKKQKKEALEKCKRNSNKKAKKQCKERVEGKYTKKFSLLEENPAVYFQNQ